MKKCYYTVEKVSRIKLGIWEYIFRKDIFFQSEGSLDGKICKLKNGMWMNVGAFYGYVKIKAIDVEHFLGNFYGSTEISYLKKSDMA